MVVILLVLLCGAGIAGGLWVLLRDRRPSDDLRPADATPSVVAVAKPAVRTQGARAAPAAGGADGVVASQAEDRVAEVRPPPVQRRPARVSAARYTSPSEMLAWIKGADEMEDPGKKRVAVIELGREIAAENFENALSLAGGIADATTRNWLYEGMFSMQARSHPAAALRAAEALNPERGGGTAAGARRGEPRKDYYTALLATMESWAAVDPAAAMKHVEQMPADLVDRALISVYGAWAESDPGSAIEKAAEITRGIRVPVLHAIFSGWAKHDAAGAVRYAAGMDDPSVLPRIYKGIAEGFLSTWDRQDPRSAADWAIDAFPKAVIDRVLPEMYARWAESDPESAARHVLQIDRGREVDVRSAFGNIMKQWAESDLDGAVAWIDRGFPNDEDYMWAVSSLTETMRYKNPVKTAELLERMPFTYADETPGASEVAKLMAFWNRKDSPSAVQWVENLTHRDLQIVAVKSLAANWTSQNYEEALAWASSMADPDLKAYALSNVALRQALHGMQKPDLWIKELPQGFVQTRTAAGFVLGALMRARDDASASLVRQQLFADELNVSRLSQIVRGSRLDDGTKDKLLGLLH